MREAEPAEAAGGMSRREWLATVLREAESLCRRLAPTADETDLERALEPESELRLQVAIPREREVGNEPVFISAGATVLRCEPLGPTTRHHTGARWAVAARFHKQPEISLPLAEEFPPRRSN